MAELYWFPTDHFCQIKCQTITFVSVLEFLALFCRLEPDSLDLEESFRLLPLPFLHFKFRILYVYSISAVDTVTYTYTATTNVTLCSAQLFN